MKCPKCDMKLTASGQESKTTALYFCQSCNSTFKRYLIPGQDQVLIAKDGKKYSFVP